MRGNSGSSLAPGPLPPNEAERLSTVRRYDILDTPRDGAFDRIARLAARFLRAPIATVTIVDEDRIWFKTSHGLDVDQIDRLPGLCASAILQDDCYVVTDAAIDPRTLTNPLVTGELGLRFYAAAPLVTHDGYRLGTINVIDRLPRLISEQETATLVDLAALVVDELELRLSARNFLSGPSKHSPGWARRCSKVRSHRLFRRFPVWILRACTGRPVRGWRSAAISTTSSKLKTDPGWCSSVMSVEKASMRRS